MDPGPDMMKQMSKFGTGSRVCFLMVGFCFLFPTALYAEESYSESSTTSNSQNTSSPFKISKKSEFHCAEVDNPVIGSPVSHEITVDPKRVERCLYKQLGSRLNECKKLKIENASVDEMGLVTLDTDNGPVRFSAQDVRSSEKEEPRIALVWTWPDTDMKYLCTALSSRR